MIDGKLYDADSMRELHNDSSVKDHNVDFTYDDSSDTFHVVVDRSDGRTWEWDLQSDRLGDLVDNLDRVGSMLDEVDRLGANLDTLSCTATQSLEQLQEVPDDFYSYISDVAGQIVFFISLLFGLLVFIVFSSSFRK